jgi:hypothetical protein
MGKRTSVIVDGERVKNLWQRRLADGSARYDVQVRIEGKPTFRVLGATTLEDALVEIGRAEPTAGAVESHSGERGFTVPAMAEPVEISEIREELVDAVRQAVREELQAWTDSATNGRLEPVVVPDVVLNDLVPPDPVPEQRPDVVARELEHVPYAPEPRFEPEVEEAPQQRMTSFPEREADRRFERIWEATLAPSAFPLARPIDQQPEPVQTDTQEWIRRLKERGAQQRRR